MRIVAALSLALLIMMSGADPTEARSRHGIHKHHAHHQAKVRSHRVGHVRAHRARVRHASKHRRARHARAVPLASNLVTVQTAAGIKITVASHLANRFQGFIADLVASGYKPRHIGCFARGGHVSRSRHYAGAACDIDQTGWGKTARPMYHVASLAAKHGLRDGCTFRDCGHVDDGAPLRRRYAARARVL